MTSLVLEGPEGLTFMQLIARKGALKLELRGLKRRGRSAYSICKSEYGLKGSRESVLRQMQALVDAAIAAKQAQRECQCTNYAGDNGACNATH
jgi:hypothetical protein